MSTWQILYQAIPRGCADAVANKLNVTADIVRRWRREPLSDDAPVATGQRSPLDRIFDFIDAVFLVNPQGSSLVVNAIRDHHECLLETHSVKRACKKQTAADLLRECVDVVNALNLDAPDEVVDVQLAELKHRVDSAVLRRRSDALGIHGEERVGDRAN